MMRVKITFLLLLFMSNLVIAQSNTPDNLFDWLEFVAALISFIVGWFIKQPQELFKKK